MAFAELAKNLVKCDYLLKNCPEVLRDELANPRYKIIYDKNGKIIGRKRHILKVNFFVTSFILSFLINAGSVANSSEEIKRL